MRLSATQATDVKAVARGKAKHATAGAPMCSLALPARARLRAFATTTVGLPASLHLVPGPRTYDFFMLLKDLDVAVEHVLLLVQLLAFVIFPIQVLVATLPRHHTQAFATGRYSSCGSRSDRGGARQRIAANLRPVLLDCPAADDAT